MAQVRFNYQTAIGDYLERLKDSSSSSLSLSNKSERDGDPDKVKRRGEKITMSVMTQIKNWSLS